MGRYSGTTRRGRVYFVAAPVEDGVMVKVGWTGGCPHRRCDQMRIGSPLELDVLGHFIGTANDEARLHSELAERRQHGEWFFFDSYQDLWALIDREGARA